MLRDIKITDFQDLKFTLVISYVLHGTELNLIIDKDSDTELLELYTAPLNQYDALLMAARHEDEKQKTEVMQILKPESLFESIAAITRDHAKRAYGIDL